MSDSCICLDVDGPGGAISITTRKAKKEHVCGECREPIKIGDEYEYVFGVWDCDASVQKTCKTCVKVRDEYFKCGYYYGEIYNCIRDDIRENCDKPTSACNACGECDAIMPEKLKQGEFEK